MLTGTWIAQGAVFGGQPLPMPDTRLVIRGDRYVIEAGAARDEGRLTIDCSVTPPAMDIVGTAGPNAGKAIPAIFRQRGNLLQICYAVGEDTVVQPRPATLDAPPGSMQLLIRYRRLTGGDSG